MTVGIDDDAVINNIILTNQSSTPTTPGAGKTRIFTKADGLHFVNSNGYDSFVGLRSVCNGRLTLTSGTAITTSDVTAATVLYFNPYKGDQIGLYNGTSWDIIEFDTTALSLVGITGSVNYDIFAYNDSGLLALESLAWSNNTTRSIDLAFQDGIYIKSGVTTRRYLGTIRASANGQCEDSITSRFVWNYYNPTERNMHKEDATSHNYTTSTERNWNGDANLNTKFVIGVAERVNSIVLTVQQETSYAYVSYDASTFPTGTLSSLVCHNNATAVVRYGVSGFHFPTVGYHYYQIGEYGLSGATQTHAFMSALMMG